MLATVVDTKALLETVAASFVAGIGVVTAFALAIYAWARFADARRDGRIALATASAVLALVALAVWVAGIAAGLYVVAE
jgi:hypothetical protein